MKDDQKKKQVSPEKLAANRKNAMRSTGPRTQAGKQRASQNPYKHGHYSNRLFPTKELVARDWEGYTQVLAAYQSHYGPVGDLESYCVEQIAGYSLRLARLLEHEQKVLTWRAPFEAHSVDRIVRYESNVSRLRDKTIDRLERLQAARQAKSSQLDSSNLEEDDAISNKDDATEGHTEAPQEPELEEPQDGRTPSSAPAAITAKAGLDVETGFKQESGPVNGEQPNKAAETSDSIGSSNFVESREDEEMIKLGDDQEELGCN